MKLLTEKELQAKVTKIMKEIKFNYGKYGDLGAVTKGSLIRELKYIRAQIGRPRKIDFKLRKTK